MLRQYVFPIDGDYIDACEQLAADRTPFELSFNGDGNAVITLNPEDFLPGYWESTGWWSMREWMEAHSTVSKVESLM